MLFDSSIKVRRRLLPWGGQDLRSRSKDRCSGRRCSSISEKPENEREEEGGVNLCLLTSRGGKKGPTGFQNLGAKSLGEKSCGHGHPLDRPPAWTFKGKEVEERQHGSTGSHAGAIIVVERGSWGLGIELGGNGKKGNKNPY